MEMNEILKLAAQIVEKLSKDDKLMDGYLSAICAAPLVLGHRGYLDGLRATCYPGFEDQLGTAQHVKEITVVRDGRVITAPGMGCAQQFGLALVEVLRGTTEAERIRRSIMTPEA